MPHEEEVCLNLRSGCTLRFPTAESSPCGVQYVRFMDGSGQEIAYWDSREWQDSPQAVMGGILGKLSSLFPGPVTSGSLREGGE